MMATTLFSSKKWEISHFLVRINVKFNTFPVFVIGTPKFQDWVAISIKS